MPTHFSKDVPLLENSYWGKASFCHHFCLTHLDNVHVSADGSLVHNDLGRGWRGGGRIEGGEERGRRESGGGGMGMGCMAGKGRGGEGKEGWRGREGVGKKGGEEGSGGGRGGVG